MRARKTKGVAVTVRSRPGARHEGLIAFEGAVYPCALGRGGIEALKREGDGATPLASMRPVKVYYRADRRRAGPGPVRLPAFPIRSDLGWCDAPDDANYNRPVRLPFAASHESMLREDQLYDVCVVLDWNYTKRSRQRGSAIFLHIAKPGFQPTEGCIAVSPAVMRLLLPILTTQARITVSR